VRTSVRYSAFAPAISLAADTVFARHAVITVAFDFAIFSIGSHYKKQHCLVLNRAFADLLKGCRRRDPHSCRRLYLKRFSTPGRRQFGVAG
jgi:hypothetical protein